MTDDELRRAYAGGRSRPRDRTGCPDPTALVGLIERTGPEPERLAVLDHVMTCPACRADFDLMRTFATSPAPKRWPMAPLMAAAVALLTVGVGAGLWWRADQARSVTRGRNGGVALLTPPNAEIGTGSALAWRPVDREVRYEVEIRTLRGELVARQELTDTVAVITLPDGAETGQSAYWSVVARLEDGSDVRSAPRPIRLVRK